MKHFKPPATLPPPLGLGLRAPHMDEVSWKRPAVGFFEVHPENYIVDRRALDRLTALRSDYPLSLHAVGLSLGSRQGVDEGHLAALRELTGRLDPILVSDHLSWSRVGGVFLNDLLPLPLTHEALDVVARNVETVQNALKRPILIENPSAYIRFRESDFEETEFLRLLAGRTGCGLLLDVNNVFVSAANLGFDAQSYLRAFPFEAVREIHVAGHRRNEVDGATVLIDDHGSPVPAPVWALYSDAVARVPAAATLVEWDSNLPAFDVLLAERDKARLAARAALMPEASSGLAALQDGIARIVLGGTEDEPDFGISGHLSVYRNNVRESLTEALRVVYRGVEELVGKAFFRQTAFQFIAMHPPALASLAAYGEAFPDFLGELHSCRSIPYLKDVAVLEWYASRTSLHAMAPPIDAECLKNWIDKEPSLLCFKPQPGLFYLASAYPADEIWRFAREGGEGTPPSLDNAPAFLEIGPGPDGVTIRRLDEAEFYFRRALSSGVDLGTAAAMALKADNLFVLFASLRSVLSDGIFIDCHIGQCQFEEIKSCMC